METKELLKRLQSIKPQIKNRFHVKEISSFGSYIRNEQKAKGDIDLLVDFDSNADFIDYMGLNIFLEEELHTVVDIVPKNSLRAELKEQVIKEAKLI